MKNISIGVLLSSNGAVFKELFSTIKKNNLNIVFNVVVDRSCGVIDFCIENNINYIHITTGNNKELSVKAFEFFSQYGADFVLLYFSRMITSDLFNQYTCFNIHPSFLPQHKGMQAIQHALDDYVLFQGCSLHIVNEAMDGGKILIQNIISVNSSDSLIYRNKLSFLQKCLVTFILFDYLMNEQYLGNGKNFILNNVIKGINTNPTFQSTLFLSEFQKIEMQENIKVYYE